MNPARPVSSRVRFVSSLIALSWLAVSPLVRAAVPGVEDFCFLQISDLHINPQPVGAPDPKPGDRSVATLAWFCERANKTQELAPAGITTPVPAFIIATGDLTEYGVIHKTWANFESFLQPLDMPIYFTPGNHDNTWTAMQHIMRKRHGGDHYSFDRFGCHFASINTATIQEPVPAIEARTLTWLREDLAGVDRKTPVFLFCHHPLSSGEFAKPHEQLRLLEVIENHNVVLLLMGHGHSARHEKWGTLDSVMGGETFRQNDGYNIISVIDGTLRVVYQYKDPERGMKLLLEKPVAPLDTPRIRFHESWKAPESRNASYTQIKRAELDVTILARAGTPDWVSVALDGDDKKRVELAPANPTQSTGAYAGKLSLEGLTPGLHFVQATARFGDLTLDEAQTFLYQPDSVKVEMIRDELLEAGAKAQPLVLAEVIYLCLTSGRMMRSPLTKGLDTPQTIHDAGVEILHAPAADGDTLYFSAAEKGVTAITRDGKLKWQRDVGAVVYGTPALEGDRVYVADLEGKVHAIDRNKGRLIWSKPHAQYSVEQSVLAHDGAIYFGAWDGFVYAVNAEDGSLKWKVKGPAAHREDRKFSSRYYAPGDCSPIIVGGRLFVTDRAYVLGGYTLEGEYTGEITEGVAAISPSRDGRSFYARHTGEGLTRFDAKGNVIWKNPVPLGRFPIPPTEQGNRVYVCSNLGRLTMHDAGTGRTIGEFQVTPQLHVMAPVAADRRGNVYVAGMDGTITQVRWEE